MHLNAVRTLGAHLNEAGRCTFKVWAPFFTQLELELIPLKQNSYRVPMVKDEEGYFQLTVPGIMPGDKYYYALGERYFPDLAADYLPEGIQGPGEIIIKSKVKKWVNRRSLSSYIIYELHVGTYTPEGTFAALIAHLPELHELGITAVELMPIAQFSGVRNWGYDGVFPFAVQNSYGGPAGLSALINACHELDIAVILDVVYNHIGPEGNYFAEFGPYFTAKYQTIWGKSLNFDDAYNHHVRRYFIENALHWFTEYGIDALRLDALHAVVDNSAYPFLEELSDEVALLAQNMECPYYLIAESSANDTRLIRNKKHYGFGMHAQWNDEFHHALHSVLTKEQHSYYADFGALDLFIKAYTEGYVYSGQYSRFRHHPHGISSATLPAERFVVFMQNHDHIGNRALGDRLTHSLSLVQLKFSAALLFFSPYIPLVFMGEEYGETAPFQYFISHQDPQLIENVRQGRKKEFAFIADEIPDPQAESTFLHCKLNHALKSETIHQQLWGFYQQLITLRKTKRALSILSKEHMRMNLIEGDLLFITREAPPQTVLLIANFSEHLRCFSSYLTLNEWHLLLDSAVGERDPDKIPSFGILIFERITKIE